MYKSVDVRSAQWREREREQRKSFSFLSLVSPSLHLSREGIDFFLLYRERDIGDIVLLKQ